MSAESIAQKMNSLLQEVGIIAKSASNAEPGEACVLATSLIQVADQMDRAGAEKAISYVDKALARLAKDGVEPTNTVVSASGEIGAELLLKAATATLIRLSDRFDAMGKEAVSEDLDKALAILAN